MQATDFSYANPPKEAVRDGNIETVREARAIFSQATSSLRCDWIELPGNNAPTLYGLVQRRMLSPGYKFIGVDLDTNVLQSCAAYHFPLTKDAQEWVHGNLISILRNDRDVWPNAGVLNFDSFRQSRGKLVRGDLEVLIDFARRRQARLGEFLLILNVACREGRANATARMRETLTELLDRDVPESAFAIYRSEGKRTFMLNARLRFGF